MSVRLLLLRLKQQEHGTKVECKVEQWLRTKIWMKWEVSEWFWEASFGGAVI